MCTVPSDCFKKRLRRRCGGRTGRWPDGAVAGGAKAGGQWGGDGSGRRNGDGSDGPSLAGQGRHRRGRLHRVLEGLRREHADAGPAGHRRRGGRRRSDRRRRGRRRLSSGRRFGAGRARRAVPRPPGPPVPLRHLRRWQRLGRRGRRRGDGRGHRPGRLCRVLAGHQRPVGPSDGGDRARRTGHARVPVPRPLRARDAAPALRHVRPRVHGRVRRHRRGPGPSGGRCSGRTPARARGR